MEPTTNHLEPHKNTHHHSKPRAGGNYRQKEQTKSYLLLKSLLVDENADQRKETFWQLDETIRAEKLTYKELENELLSIVKSEHKISGKSHLKTFIPRLFDIYTEAKQVGVGNLIPVLALKANQRIKDSFPEDFDKDIKQVALDFWTKVESNNIGTFLRIFDIEDIIKPQDILPKIEKLLKNKKIEEAVNYISTLDLHQHFDAKDLIRTLVTYKLVDPLGRFIQNKPDLQKFAIKELINHRNAPKAADFVKEFKFDPNDFPPLIEILEKSSLRFHISQNDWMALEEKFYDAPHILGYYVEDLLQHRKLDEALSIIQRHNLDKGNLLTQEVRNQISPYLIENSPTKTFNYLENQLFITDAYEPTEELLGQATPGTYLNFRDFGIDPEKDFVWVDNCESEVFEKAVEDMLSSDVVGLDSEFKFSLTKFDIHGTDLLQLSTYKRMYLIDAKSLSKEEKYNDFIDKLLSNPSIAKIGHTLSADLSKLKVAKVGEKEQVVRAQIDISKIYQVLYPRAKHSLAAICEAFLKKPMSKFEQLSNWQNRPLRKAQMHYGAMDAYVCLKLYDKLKIEILSRGHDIEEFTGGLVSKKEKAKVEKAPKRTVKEEKKPEVIVGYVGNKLQEIVKKQVKQEDPLIKETPLTHKEEIEALIAQKNYTKAGNLIKTYGLNIDDYKSVRRMIEFASLKFYIKEFPNWMSIEEKFTDRPRVLGLFVEDLIKKGKPDIALSIYKRNNLDKEDVFFPNNIKSDLALYLRNPPEKTFQYLENTLFTNDDYEPAEEVIGEAPKGKYCCLKDFGLDVGQDLIWIDDCEAEVFNNAVKDIMSCQAIGLDTEFRAYFTKFDKSGISLLQIATHKKIYIFDAKKISNDDKYNDFVFSLWSNPGIIKAGHTLSADISQLRKSKKGKEQLEIVGNVDIDKLYKVLYPDMKYSLAAICEAIIKKPMSKFDQMSNWHRRPLRKAQQHYAALDAIVTLQIYDKLKEEIASRGENVEEFIKTHMAPRPKKAKAPRYTKKILDQETEDKEGNEHNNAGEHSNNEVHPEENAHHLKKERKPRERKPRKGKEHHKGPEVGNETHLEESKTLDDVHQEKERKKRERKPKKEKEHHESGEELKQTANVGKPKLMKGASYEDKHFVGESKLTKHYSTNEGRPKMKKGVSYENNEEAYKYSKSRSNIIVEYVPKKKENVTEMKTEEKL